jgi:hypothetical protein
MSRALRTVLCVLLSLPAIAAYALAQNADIVKITTPRGIDQPILLIEVENPIASVVLIAGGHGALGLKDTNTMEWGDQNFLVRTREKFAARKLMVAVLDAPSDRPDGLDTAFRLSNAHAGDIGAVGGYLKQLADVPVWLVGTSMGTFSAAQSGIAADNVDGLVLASTVTRPRRHWKVTETLPDGVASMALDEIQVPTLVLMHAHDACDISPADGAAKVEKRLENAKPVEVVILDGGLPPISEPCQSRAQHGFYGIEDKAIDAIVSFIAANSKAGAKDAEDK